MQTDRTIKALLAIISISLVANASKNWVISAHAATPTTQVWEYKFINREFAYGNGVIGAPNQWVEDGKTLPSPVDTSIKLQQLGADGWELVTVTPYAFSYESRFIETGGSDIRGFTKGYSSNMNGVTTTDKWVFKRLRH